MNKKEKMLTLIESTNIDDDKEYRVLKKINR